MSRLRTISYTTHPPIVTGPDLLPHCGWCLNERVLCLYHANQVRTGLDTLVSATTLARAEADIRYIVAKRPRGQLQEDAVE